VADEAGRRPAIRSFLAAKTVHSLMETYILAACFFTSIVANVALMAGLVAKRQKTTLEFAGKSLQVHLHQGNVHLVSGLVLYEKGRHAEAVAMLQEAVRHDPDDRMADAMLQIALNAGSHGVAGLPPSRDRFRLPSRAGADPDGIIDAVIQDVAPEDALLPAAADAAAPQAELPPSESPSDPVAAGLFASVEADLAEAVRLGLTMVRRGEVDQALTHFETLTRQHPDSRIARTGQAIALKHVGRDDEAAEVLRQTLQQAADRPQESA
jgi:Flp pilus assembly protein TadD